ncbi:hypothetical protein PG993_010572 [Apiospora rasikravindrae]|uniref:Uncharacterized protein n=1 Tax=Apiospora rasikravindrae TaxID=990691 RepID=A0ABR1SMP2_9PEZI
MESASGNVTVDIQQPPPVNESATFRDPDPATIKCSSTDQSPSYFDCVHTFQSDLYREFSMSQGKKGDNQVAAHAETCAINVSYLEDWDDSCNATLGDVLDHARGILRKCNNGQLGPDGRCEGQVAFTVPHCPANIRIVHTTVDG